MSKLTVRQPESLSQKDIGRKLFDTNGLYGRVRKQKTGIAFGVAIIICRKSDADRREFPPDCLRHLLEVACAECNDDRLFQVLVESAASGVPLADQYMLFQFSKWCVAASYPTALEETFCAVVEDLLQVPRIAVAIHWNQQDISPLTLSLRWVADFSGIHILFSKRNKPAQGEIPTPSRQNTLNMIQLNKLIFAQRDKRTERQAPWQNPQKNWLNLLKCSTRFRSEAL